MDKSDVLFLTHYEQFCLMSKNVLSLSVGKIKELVRILNYTIRYSPII